MRLLIMTMSWFFLSSCASIGSSGSSGSSGSRANPTTVQANKTYRIEFAVAKRGGGTIRNRYGNYPTNLIYIDSCGSDGVVVYLKKRRWISSSGNMRKYVYKADEGTCENMPFNDFLYGFGSAYIYKATSIAEVDSGITNLKSKYYKEKEKRKLWAIESKNEEKKRKKKADQEAKERQRILELARKIKCNGLYVGKGVKFEFSGIFNTRLERVMITGISKNSQSVSMIGKNGKIFNSSCTDVQFYQMVKPY